MFNLDNYKRQHKRYSFGEQGLYFEDSLIAYCNPVLDKIVVYSDPVEKKSFTRYFVKALLPGGLEGEVKELSSFDKLSCFDLWHSPDINDSGKEQKLIKSKLQLEAAMMRPEKYILCRSGLQWYNNQPLYVLGDRVIGKDNIDENVVVNQMNAYSVYSEHKRDDLCLLAEKVINILPGTSEIMFYYALQAVIKPILHEIGINTDYLLAVIGPSGHLKTSLSKKIFLWLSDKGKQSVSFSSPLRTNRLLDNMDQYSGMNFLVDDFHEYEMTQDIERQNRRLDAIVRHVDDNPACPNIIITGEFIQGIFSCIDRTFITNIPRMDAEKLTVLKEKVNQLPNNLMGEVAVSFTESLISNIVSVKEECMKFYQKNCVDRNTGNENATRTHRHCMLLRLTEVLYREYMCRKSDVLSCRDALEKAIVRQYEIQQRQLQKIRATEQQDYVLEVYQMLSSNNKYVKVLTDDDKYSDYYRTCLQKNNTIYITRNALNFGMMQYYQRTVNINKIVKCLENEGMLNVGTDSITKKFRGKRHYLINVDLITAYIKYKKMWDGVV